ncbi:hypothetical protein Tco_0249205, partial [Tanacetum coccineum]
EVVNLSESTQIPTPPANIIQPEKPVEHGDTQDRVVFSDANSFHSKNDVEDDGDATTHRFVPKWELRDDLRNCSFRACKELVSHLATSAEDEFLCSLSNVEIIRRAYGCAFDVV